MGPHGEAIAANPSAPSRASGFRAAHTSSPTKTAISCRAASAGRTMAL